MLPDFAERSAQAELMDAGMTSFACFDESLRQIETVNSLTLGYRPVLAWLEQQAAAAPAGLPLTVLDVGCGRGALLRAIWKRARRRNMDMRLQGVDINPWSKPAAEKSTSGYMRIDYRTADVFAPALSQKPDFIITSHMTHHLKEEELVRFLRLLDDRAARGWFIMDLHRHPLPYFVAKCLLFLAPVNGMVRNDGPVSVTRGFTAAEWRAMLGEAGIPLSQCKIQWFFPFRYGISRTKA